MIRRNLLTNQKAMRKLNPHAPILKKYSRLQNERRRAAREVLRQKRNGVKVDPKAVTSAAKVLNLKLRTWKQKRAEDKKVVDQKLAARKEAKKKRPQERKAKKSAK